MPLLQAIHIVMIGIVFVSLLMIACACWVACAWTRAFDAVWARFAPWMWTGLAVMAATGLVLIIGEPVREATALSFWLKMGLISLPCWLANALRRSLAGHAGPRFPSGARFVAVCRDRGAGGHRLPGSRHRL